MAQLIECQAHNSKVQGSTPGWGRNYFQVATCNGRDKFNQIDSSFQHVSMAQLVKCHA